MTEDEKELGAIIIRAQAKQHGDEETLSTVAERAYRLGRETEQRETASLRHAALFAAGIHGGPGAWRWASDTTGTTLADVAAWERLLGEMRERTASPTPAIYCPNCEATGFPPSGHSWPSLEPWWIDGAKLCCTECGACLVVRADGERASLELDEPDPAERKPPTWIPDPEGGEYLAIPGDPGVHLGAWVNSGHGPHWSVAFDKQGCFPQHAETLDEAKADAIACAERELSAIVAKGEEAARVLSVLRGSQ